MPIGSGGIAEGNQIFLCEREPRARIIPPVWKPRTVIFDPDLLPRAFTANRDALPAQKHSMLLAASPQTTCRIPPRSTSPRYIPGRDLIEERISFHRAK